MQRPEDLSNNQDHWSNEKVDLLFKDLKRFGIEEALEFIVGSMNNLLKHEGDKFVWELGYPFPETEGESPQIKYRRSSLNDSTPIDAPFFHEHVTLDFSLPGPDGSREVTIKGNEVTYKANLPDMSDKTEGNSSARIEFSKGLVKAFISPRHFDDHNGE